MRNNLTKISVFVLMITIILSIYIMYNGLGLIKGLDFGAGSYYYTDIPNWDKIFFGEKSINLGTNHPILFFSAFFLWGIICYRFLCWMEKN